jgi:hypothetical protein
VADDTARTVVLGEESLEWGRRAPGCRAYSGQLGVARSDEGGLWDALVAHFEAETAVPVRVEPRALLWRGDLTEVTESDLETGAARREGVLAVLERRGIPKTNAADEMRCVFSVGAAPVPGDPTTPETERRRTECRQRDEYATLVFSQPEPVLSAQTVRVRTVVLTRSSFAAWEVHLTRDRGGLWRVAGARRLVGVTS